MDMVSLLISLVSGVVGGNAAGAAMPADKNLGAIGNSIAGLFGGGFGGYAMQALGLLAQVSTQASAAGSTGMDLTSILTNIGASGVGGAVLTAVVGLIKNAMNKNA